VCYEEDRIHDTLGKDIPNLRPVKKPSGEAKVISNARLGGLMAQSSIRELLR